jgi:UDP-3-O-[3-hydroxymyristoyl] N-acetylglucosamine deacetylase
VEHRGLPFSGWVSTMPGQVDGPEVPIMDSSAAPFIFRCDPGIREQKSPKRSLSLSDLEIHEGGAPRISLPELKISYAIDFNHPAARPDRTFSGRTLS